MVLSEKLKVKSEKLKIALARLRNIQYFFILQFTKGLKTVRRFFTFHSLFFTLFFLVLEYDTTNKDRIQSAPDK